MCLKELDYVLEFCYFSRSSSQHMWRKGGGEGLAVLGHFMSPVLFTLKICKSKMEDENIYMYRCMQKFQVTFMDTRSFSVLRDWVENHGKQEYLTPLCLRYFPLWRIVIVKGKIRILRIFVIETHITFAEDSLTLKFEWRNHG